MCYSFFCDMYDFTVSTEILNEVLNYSILRLCLVESVLWIYFCYDIFLTCCVFISLKLCMFGFKMWPQRSNTSLNSAHPHRCVFFTPKFTPAPGKRPACVWKVETVQSSPQFTKLCWDRTASRHLLIYELEIIHLQFKTHTFLTCTLILM